jgi:hypothetical protein
VNKKFSGEYCVLKGLGCLNVGFLNRGILGSIGGLAPEFTQALEDREKDRTEQNRQGCGGQHSSENGGSDGLLAGKACTGGKHQRQTTANADGKTK